MNAQEVMHFKFYTGAGKQHDLVEGLEAIAAIVNEYERRENAERGVFILPVHATYMFCSMASISWHSNLLWRSSGNHSQAKICYLELHQAEP